MNPENLPKSNSFEFSRYKQIKNELQENKSDSVLKSILDRNPGDGSQNESILALKKLESEGLLNVDDIKKYLIAYINDEIEAAEAKRNDPSVRNKMISYLSRLSTVYNNILALNLIEEDTYKKLFTDFDQDYFRNL